MNGPAITDIRLVEPSFRPVTAWEGGLVYFFVHKWVEDRTVTPWEGFYIDDIKAGGVYGKRKKQKTEVTLVLRDGKIYTPEGIFGKVWSHSWDAPGDRTVEMSAGQWRDLKEFWDKHRDLPGFPGSENPPGELLLEGRHLGIFKTPERPL